MLIEVIHETKYEYAPAVDIAQHIMHLKPIETINQQVVSANITIEPLPEWLSETTDVFGNHSAFFSIQSTHEKLDILAHSVINTSVLTLPPDATASSPAWEKVRDYFRYHVESTFDPAVEYVFSSPFIRPHPNFKDFSQSLFTPERPILDLCEQLMREIYEGLEYTKESTDIDTPAHEAIKNRRGVCQDFAHIFISCARMQGLASRYVSGYLVTDPPPGKPRLIGSDASHAWASIYVPSINLQGALCPGHWYDFDPTNNHWGLGSPGEHYITLAYGRDYSDISPIKGVIHGGEKHTMEVAVTVQPIE